jgi:hypothetical protein
LGFGQFEFSLTVCFFEHVADDFEAHEVEDDEEKNPII